MNKLMIAFVATASLFTFGCKKKGGAAGEAMAKMEGFSKTMCECKDKACADKVNEDMTKWGTEMAKTAGKEASDEKPDPEMAKKSADIMTKYTECMTKLMMASMTPPPGDKPADKPADVKTDDKKPDEVKADDKKPDDKKADDKKPDDKKPDDKKADDKKPDDKKAGGW